MVDRAAEAERVDRHVIDDIEKHAEINKHGKLDDRKVQIHLSESGSNQSKTIDLHEPVKNLATQSFSDENTPNPTSGAASSTKTKRKESKKVEKSYTEGGGVSNKLKKQKCTIC
jgi:hypothetical protein